MRRFTQTNPLSGYTPSVSGVPTYGQSAMTNNYGALSNASYSSPQANPAQMLGILQMLQQMQNRRQSYVPQSYSTPSDSSPARGSNRFYFSEEERTAAPRPSSGQRPKKLNVSLFRGANKAPRPQNLVYGYKKTLTPSDVEGLAARGYTPDTWPGNPYGHPALDFMTMNYGYKQPIMGHEISDWNPDFGKDVPNNGMFRMKQNTVQNLGRFQPAGKLPSLF